MRCNVVNLENLSLTTVIYIYIYIYIYILPLRNIGKLTKKYIDISSRD